MATPGQFITILEPNTFVGELLPSPAVLPSRNLPVGDAWPTGWIPVQNTANGVQITPINPHQDVTSDENGVIATLASGADTINLTWQSRTPEERLVKWISGFAKRTTPAQNEQWELTVTAGVTGAGTTLNITLPGSTATTVTVAAADDLPSEVATKIIGAAYAGWADAAGSTAAKVLFTKDTAGASTGTPVFDAGTTGVTASFLKTRDSFAAFDEFYLDPTENNEFMVGIEGTFQAGSLRETAGVVRIFAYRVQQTDNPQLAARTTGADGILQPVATVRCLPGDIQPAQLANTGIVTIDPKKRFSWFIF